MRFPSNLLQNCYTTGCEFRLKRSGGGQRNRQAGETSRVEMGDEAVLGCHGCICAG